MPSILDMISSGLPTFLSCISSCFTTSDMSTLLCFSSFFAFSLDFVSRLKDSSYKFSSVGLSNFGKAIELDHLENWFGTDLLICGHVHKIMDFDDF